MNVPSGVSQIPTAARNLKIAEKFLKIAALWPPWLELLGNEGRLFDVGRIRSGRGA